jgi:4-amino-4-deoxy-L-arabinose transferase-like glycosyltransferase
VDPETSPESGARRALALVALAVACLSTLPRLFDLGMYLDGTTYAAIARNLAEGVGEPWAPHYTQTAYNEFFEHPPAGFWLEAIAFRLFGDHALVESLFGFASGVALVLVMLWLWRSLAMARDLGVWLPLLLFFACPLASWMFANNMLDSTMSPFALAAVLGALRGARAVRRRTQILWGLVCGASSAAAFLIKGPTGLFALAAPGLAWLALEEVAVAAACRTAAAALGALGLVAFGLWQHGAAHAFFARYFDIQVLAGISGQREHAASRLVILAQLGGQLIYPAAGALALAVGVSWRAHGRRLAPSWTLPRGEPLFLLLVALSASLPIMISLKQQARYAFASLPFFAMFLASVVSPAGQWVQRTLACRARTRLAAAVAGLLGLGALAGSVANYDVIRAHPDFHRDFTRQRLVIPEEALISVCPSELEHDWALVANMARYFKASLTAEPGAPFLLARTAASCAVPPSCTPMHPPQPHAYLLYDCRGGATTGGAARPGGS